MLKAKKSLGQHFLNDDSIAEKIVSAFTKACKTDVVLEIGPGTGMLTKYLLHQDFRLYAIEPDKRMIDLLSEKYPSLKPGLIHGDFLDFDLQRLQSNSVALIGNFPYNISTEILFRTFENRAMIPLMTGMFQKEVAMRIAAGHGNKDYGVPTVLLQAFYDVEYLFEAGEESFTPPPKVKSAVIQLKRKDKEPLIPDVRLFTSLVKAGFGQRRKMLRNSLAGIVADISLLSDDLCSRRAEQLSVEEWINLAKALYPQQ